MSPFRRGIVRPVDVAGLLIATGTVLAGVALPPPAGMAPEVQAVLAIFLATVVLWVTEAVPYAISSLLCVVLLFAFGPVDSFGEAVQGFASSLIFFFILLLLIGQSVAAVDLDAWVASRLVSTHSTPRSSVRRLAGTILGLAFVMPSGMARTVTFMPVIDEVNDRYRGTPDSAFRRLAYYVIGHLNPLGSIALMTGGGMSIVTAEMINTLVRPITWLEWAVFMTPPIVALFLGCVVVAGRFYDVETVARTGDAEDRSARREREATPDRPPAGAGEGAWASLTREQRIVVATMAGGIAMWIVGSFLGIPAIVPAMLMVLLFSLPGVSIVTADEFREISWGIVFLIGAMLSMLEIMESIDALTFVIDHLLAILPMDRHVSVVLLILLGVTIAFRGLFSGVSASIVILFPMLIEFAEILGLEPLFFGFALLIVLGTTTFVPFNQPTILLAYQRGPLSLREVVGLGAVTLAMGLVVVAVSWTVYWPFVEGSLSGMR